MPEYELDLPAVEDKISLSPTMAAGFHLIKSALPVGAPIPV